ncbi:MAG: tRNA (adenosine(37)-N6)-threonylcarbamoyltransferase complex ATPase subunit type 1 TsaE [Patescibacteria group bacterium]|jgi:tRNA threonylcarbamoyladenosine biosynthesis protein TsaE
MIETKKKYYTENEKQTKEIGMELGKQITGGGIIALYGNLGAGKTVFVKGVAKGLGIKNRITSPTFVFWRVYNLSKKRLRYFCHVDLYRLPEPSNIQSIGIEEYWGRKDTVCLIEWAEKAKRLPKKNISFKVKINILEKNSRSIEIINF